MRYHMKIKSFIVLFHQSSWSSYSVFSAPSTLPTMLYRLLKKVNQSSNVFFSLSSRSYHSGTQSSGFREDFARARETSLPAKTGTR